MFKMWCKSENIEKSWHSQQDCSSEEDEKLSYLSFFNLLPGDYDETFEKAWT